MKVLIRLILVLAIIGGGIYLISEQGKHKETGAGPDPIVTFSPRDPAPDSDTPAVALPDLVILGANCEPSGPVRPGTNCRITIRVKNQGRGNVPGAVIVAGGGGHSGGCKGLAPGETKSVVVDFQAYGQGNTLRMRFTVDPSNVTRESNETNNTSREITIQTTR